MVCFQYLLFLERISRALKMDPLAADVGLELACDAVVGRAEQLVNLEADQLSDRKTHIYNLQRKVKSLKEQLESKDLHMELLRKKVHLSIIVGPQTQYYVGKWW